MIRFMSISSGKKSSRLIRSVTERVRQSSLIPIFRVIARLIRRIVTIIYSPMAIVLLIFRIRLITLTHPERIGHLCAEPDCYIKEGILGLRAKFNGIFLIPRDRVANKVILDLWTKHLKVVTSPMVCMVLRPLLNYGFIKYPVDHYAVAIDGTAACGAILAKWGDRPPTLQNEPEAYRPAGWRVLEELGLPSGSW